METFSAFLEQYDGATSPYFASIPLCSPANNLQQEAAVAYIVDRIVSGNSSSLVTVQAGQGKAYIVLAAYDWLKRAGVKSKKLLFCVPTKAATTNILAEVEKFTSLKAVILEAKDGVAPFFNDSYDVIIAIYATLTRSPSLFKGQKQGKLMHANTAIASVRTSLDLICMDEIHQCKNKETDVFKVMSLLVNGRVHKEEEPLPVIGTTGTLVTSDKELINMWAISQLLAGDRLFGPVFEMFAEGTGLFKRSEKVVPAMKGKFGGGFQPKIITYTPLPGTKKGIEEILAPFIVNYERVTTGVDTAVVIRNTHLDHDPRVAALYGQLYSEYIDFKRHVTDKAAIHMKLMQLSSGFLYKDKPEGDKSQPENMLPMDHSSKAIYLIKRMKYLAAKGQKVLIFYQHRAVLDLLKFAAVGAKVPLLTLTAEDSITVADQIRHRFSNDESVCFLSVPYAIGAESLNFVNSEGKIVVKGVICFEIIFQRALFYQAIGRLDRIGQDSETWCEVLTTSPIEQKWLSEIKNNRKYKLEIHKK
jgi:Type III restriction enzyme, res subunit